MRRLKLWWLVGGLGLLILGSSWGAVLLASNPTEHPLAGIFPWPVACTTRGCITSMAWGRQQQLVKAFSVAVDQSVPSAEETLTTLIRQHLIDKDWLQSVVTLEDAARYRQDVLRLTDEAVTKQLSTLTLGDFDRYITLPFLKQEALRQQLKFEPNDNLFVHLSSQRWIIVLPRNLVWDEVSATVTRQ